MHVGNACRSGEILDISGEHSAAGFSGKGIGHMRIHIAEAESHEHAVFTRELMVNTNIERVLIVPVNGVKEVVAGSRETSAVRSGEELHDVERHRVETRAARGTQTARSHARWNDVHLPIGGDGNTISRNAVRTNLVGRNRIEDRASVILRPARRTWRERHAREPILEVTSALRKNGDGRDVSF